jgi:hypothetical protein
MKYGWQKGLTIYVYLNKRYRKGTLKSKIGSKWIFKPERYNRTVTVCPVRAKWHYHFKKKPITWCTKVDILMMGTKPFKFQRERIGEWSGSKTCRTHSVPMKVWQLPGSSTVIVGHLGAYTVAVLIGNVLTSSRKEPSPNDSFFIGRGALERRKFKCLKVSDCRPFLKVDRMQTVAPLYPVPSREELSNIAKF